MHLAAATLLLVGCARVDVPIAETVDATGVTTFRATVDRGDLSYEGQETSAFALSGTSTGFGASPAQAAAREAGNAVSLTADGATVLLAATSAARRAWTELAVVGPEVMDLDIEVLRGAVHVEGVLGAHAISADRITTRTLAGSAALVATSGGMDADLRPEPGSVIAVESLAGDVVLRLPWGLPYDIEVIGDPSFGMYVEELGFHASFSDVGYFSGTAGDGSIRVSVFVNGGSFQLLEAL